MSQDREIVKYGYLQTKVSKKGGTLLRKKRFVFEEQKWIVLCVHNNQIPLLEWYPTANEIQKHEPMKVVDLLNCSYVTTSISNDRHIEIGFDDENWPMMEFAAKMADEAAEWVDEIKTCLRKLNCLGEADNEYQAMPSSASDKPEVVQNEEQQNNTEISSRPPQPHRPSPPIRELFQGRINLADEIPLTLPGSVPAIPPRPPVMPKLHPPVDDDSGSSNTNSYLEQSPPCSPPGSPPGSPPIPRTRRPRPLSPVPRSRSSNSASEQLSPAPGLPVRLRKNLTPFPLSPVHKTKVANGHQYDFPLMPPAGSLGFIGQKQPQCDLSHHVDYETSSNPVNCLEKSEDLPPMVPPKGLPNLDNDFLEKDVSLRLSQEVTQLRMSSTSSSTTEDSHDSTKSHPGGYMLISPPQRPPHHLTLSSGSLNYAGAYREHQAIAKTIPLPLTICAQHLSLVEVAGSIWVAGWSDAQNATLVSRLHVGDQLISVDEKPVRGIAQFPKMFYDFDKAGIPIPLQIKTIPHGLTFILRKPVDLYTARTFGIIFHKKKNRIEEIVPLSKAARAGIPSKMNPFLYGKEDVAAVVTEVNGKPLNPFATNEQFYKRIERLPLDAEIRLVVQPYDFVKLIKQELKGNKHYKMLLQDD